MINHEADTLHSIIGFKNEDEYEKNIMEVFHKIREKENTTQEDLEFCIVHLVGAYDGYNTLVLPILSAIYYDNEEAFKDIGQLEFSYQMEAVIKYSSTEMKKLILQMFLFRLIDEFI